MSMTKRWIEELMERGEYPHVEEVRLQENTTIHDGPPYSASCPCCERNYESLVPIPGNVICPSCYMEEQSRLEEQYRH